MAKERSARASLFAIAAALCLSNANAQENPSAQDNLTAQETPNNPQEPPNTQEIKDQVGRAGPIPDDVWSTMMGKSWHSKLPCPKRSELSLLQIPYTDFEGASQVGRLVVSQKLANEVIDIFAKLQKAGFRIYSMRLMEEFNGDDVASMDANNTSAFNCRAMTAGNSMSEHAYGRAIDLNPIQNPYVVGTKTSPKQGLEFDSKEKRAQPKIGMIQQGDVVVKIFEAAGWKWGGNWRSLKDYQHFSKSGR